MKAVFINHSDRLGGASVVTRRLVEALRAHTDIDASMLVTGVEDPAPYIVRGAPRWRSRLPFLAEHLRIFAGNGHRRDTLFKISLATDGLPLHRHPAVKEADVVVLNWVNQGMLSFGEIGKIAAEKPVVWTMHDMWNLTAVCHHAGECSGYLADCSDCPMLPAGSGLARRTYDRKKSLYDASGIRFVAVSRWLAECAARSSLLRGRDISVIPNICPTVAPSGFKVPEGRLVTICAARLDDPVKGLDTAIEAVNHLPDVTFVTIGEIKNPGAMDGIRVPHIHLGTLDDADRQAVFARSAAVISTSRYESFGATLVEAQAAGATPVAFTHDGRADIIEDGVTGYVMKGDPADAIRRALERPLPAAALQAAAARFSPRTVATSYAALLRTLRVR